MTGCWISPLGCNKQDLSIHEGTQYCWFMLLLNCSGHIDIVHQEHLWCLIDICRWQKRCMLNEFLGGTNFHQYRLLKHHPGWYLPQAFLWRGLKEHESRIWDITPFFGWDDHLDTALCILKIQQRLLSSSILRFVCRFYLFYLPAFFCILFELRLGGALNISRIVVLSPTIIAGDVVKFS